MKGHFQHAIYKSSAHNMSDSLAFFFFFSTPLPVRWQLVDVITEKLRDCPEEEVTWRKRVTASALKCLIASYDRGRDQAATTHEQSVLERLQKLVVG